MGSADSRRTGVLAEWNDQRGFGFIEEEGRRTFVHVSAFDLRDGRPRAGADVRYSMSASADGRARAVQASLVPPAGSRPRPVRRSEPGRGRPKVAPLVLAALFLVGLMLAVLLLDLPLLLPLAYLVMSLATYGLYAADKRAAMAGTWRTAESTLQLAALFCGWPGAVLAQQVLRHKNSKAQFQAVFWASVVMNVVACLIVAVWLRGDVPFPGIG